ncbi:uncharacterized protein METZ01_LOCUS427332, partial [marine metagenome]
MPPVGRHVTFWIVIARGLEPLVIRSENS